MVDTRRERKLAEQPPHILIHGRDLLLLETRRRILERNQYRVTTLLRTIESDVASLDSIDLMVLCHTLSAADKQTAIDQYKKAFEDPRLIILSTDSFLRSDSANTEVLGVFDGPIALVASVKRLLPIHVNNLD
jgi:DNA-binding response OmpR family regulator